MIKKKCLITGGGGYVGSVLCRYLTNLGFSLKIYDKFYFGRKSIERSRTERRSKADQDQLENLIDEQNKDDSSNFVR